MKIFGKQDRNTGNTHTVTAPQVPTFLFSSCGATGQFVCAAFPYPKWTAPVLPICEVPFQILARKTAVSFHAT